MILTAFQNRNQYFILQLGTRKLQAYVLYHKH